MRRLLEERDFPVASIRFFASARSAGTTLPFGAARTSWSRTPRPPTRRASTSRCSPPGATARRPRPALRRGRRDRHRQLLAPGAWTPTCRSSSARSTRTRSREARKGIIANPNCTTMAAMPVLKVLHAEAGLERLIVSTYQAVSGSRARRRRGARRPGRAAASRRTTLRPGARRLRRRLPRSRRSTSRPIAFDVDPARRQSSSTTARTRPTRRRSSATRAARSSSCPELLVSRHLRARPGVHRPLAVDQRRVRDAALGRARHGAAARRSRRRARPTSRRRCRPPARTRASSAASGRTRACRTGEGLALFISNDNLRKGAALNAVQIAELVAAR